MRQSGGLGRATWAVCLILAAVVPSAAGLAIGLMLRQTIANTEAELHGLALIGADGTLINSSRSWPASAANFADHERFATMRDHADTGVHISKALMSPVTGRLTFYLARRVTAEDGRFVGVIEAAVGVEQLVSFYRSVWTANGAASL